MRLTSEQARYLADALDAMTKMTRATGVRLDPYGPIDFQIGDVTIKFAYDSAEGYGEYVINDRVGD
jgi:hypothetical protein